MKTLLNLLPEENKKDIERKTHFRFFLWQLLLFFMLEIFYMSILLGSYIIINFQSKILVTASQSETKNNKEQTVLDTYQQKFRDINTTVKVVNKINTNHFSFTEVFLLLDTLLPEDMVIDQISTKNYTISLKGKALKRENLLEFNRRLNESSCIEGVNVPIANLFSQENVEFQIDFGIKIECLKKKI